MKNIIILFVVLLTMFSAFISNAQQFFTGKLTDSDDGGPISGAVISADSTMISVLSDEEGNFELHGIKSGSTPVIISHIAYEETYITLNSGKNEPVKLSRKAYLSGEVNVFASRAGRKSAVAYTDFSKENIEKNNTGRDLPFLLNYSPSVTVTSDAGNGVGYTGIRIRGSDPTRVNVTLNGIPVNDAESHQVYWVDLPDLASSTDNIQVQRGVGTSVNGAGAFGGSINIESSRLSQNAFATISSSAGSYGTFKNTINLGSGLLGNHFAVETRLSKINSDGYIDRASTDLRSFYLSGGYFAKATSIKAVILSGRERTYQAWYGVPEDSLNANRTYNPAGEYYLPGGTPAYYDNQTDNYQQDYYQLLFSHELNKNWVLNAALHYTYGRGYYEEFSQGASLPDYNLSPVIFGNTIVSITDLTRRRWLENDFYGATWSVTSNSGKFDFRAGGAVNEYDGDHYNEIISASVSPILIYPYRYFFDKAKKSDASAYVRLIYSLSSKLSFTADLQQRLVTYDFNAAGNTPSFPSPDKNYNFFNPKAGINYQFLNNHSAYIYAGMANKEPLRDDFKQTPGNNPLPEQLTDYEAGYRGKLKNLSWEINGYYMNYKDQLILTGKINESGEFIHENVKKSYRTGIEISLSASMTNRLRINANATFSRNKVSMYENYDYETQVVKTFGNTEIAFSPSVISAGEIIYSPLKTIDITVRGKYTGSQYFSNSSAVNKKLDGYFTGDLIAAIKLLPKSVKSIALTFSVYNVLNKMYSSNAYTYDYYYEGTRYDLNYYFPQAGRNFMAGVIIKI
jgi:iron complex outermembrane recepter protein